MSFMTGRHLKRTDALRRCIYLLLAAAVLVNLKSIFTDYDGDLDYAIGMSYRMLQGDRMFTQMWEPHQTSAFLLTFLMGLYLTVTKTTTGVVIFLQSVGVLLQGVLAAVNYKVLKKRLDPTLALLMSVFLFTARPKGIVLPEYTNMQIGFSVLLFLCLLRYFEDMKKKRFLFAASVCLCLQILSYPSCVIVYFAVIVILFLYAENRWKDILCFSLFCLLQGMCYVLYFVWKIGFSELLFGIRQILNVDSSHNLLNVIRTDYFDNFFRGVLWAAACLLAAIAVGYIWRLVRGGLLKSKIVMSFGMLIFISDAACAIVGKEGPYYDGKTIYVIFYFIMILLGVAGVKYCSRQEKRLYTIGVLLSIGSFLAVFFLTNLDFLSIMAYMIVGAMISFLPLSKWLETNMDFAGKVCRFGVLLLFCAMVIFRRGYVMRAMNGLAIYVHQVEGIVKEGPAVGIVTDYMGAYATSCNMEDFDNFVKPDDRLFIVATRLNAVMYMYEDVTVCTPSTICTPTYNESLLDYWEKNPDRKPNVIAVDCWFGELRVDEDSWIYQWLQEEFQPNTYSDGRYLRFYRLQE